MSNYNLEKFKEDIKANREFEFSYHDKMYSLTFSKEGYIFTDISGKKDLVFNSYAVYKNRRKKNWRNNIWKALWWFKCILEGSIN